MVGSTAAIENALPRAPDCLPPHLDPTKSELAFEAEFEKTYSYFLDNSNIFLNFTEFLLYNKFGEFSRIF